MNAAINSTTQTSRPALWRRSKAYKQKLFRRLVIGAPIISVLGWEYRVWKRKLYYDRNKYHFPGGTHFYGKMWGYESDNMIEESLQDGDIVFWSVDPLSVHVHEAVCRFAYRHLKGDYDSWDFCGIVKHWKGRKYVIGAEGKSVLYSDLVADYRTRSLAVRKLVESNGGERRSQIGNRLEVVDSKEYVDVSAQDFLEMSLKAIVKRLGCDYLLSFVRESVLFHPLRVLSGKEPGGKFVELDEVFKDPLKDKGSEYSPPFYVRRMDGEYYNHNRTKNVVVDWELLVQREERNKMVSLGSDRQAEC